MNYTYPYGTMYYEKYGEGEKALVILPGWGDTRKSFSSIISFLSKYFSVYIVDYPGFGNSPTPTKDFTIYDYTNLIYEWMRELELQDPVLIGHSFGGRIIITLTGYYHYSFSKVILMNSAGIKPRKSFYGVLRGLLYKTLQKGTSLLPKKQREMAKQKLFDRFASEDYKNLNENMRTTFKNIVSQDLTPFLKEIESDVLLLWGDLDSSTPLSDGKQMEREILGSNLILVKGTGHFSYLENAPFVQKILYEALKEDFS